LQNAAERGHILFEFGLLRGGQGAGIPKRIRVFAFRRSQDGAESEEYLTIH
jgi:hypothetical protein